MMISKLILMQKRTCTSSSLRMGIVRTLYFCLSSLDKGADINRLLTCEGAVKCLFLFLLLDADTSLLNFILIVVV